MTTTEKRRQWYQANKKKAAIYQKVYRLKNKAKLSKQKHEYYMKHQRMFILKAAQWYKANKHLIRKSRREYLRLWRKKNPDWQLNWDRQYRKANKGWLRFLEHKRRKANRHLLREKQRIRATKLAHYYLAYRGGTNARKHGCKVDMRGVPEFYKKVRSAPNIRCFWCKQLIKDGQRTVDHYIPTSRGGSHSLKNLVAACRTCNCERHNKLPEEYREWKRLMRTFALAA